MILTSHEVLFFKISHSAPGLLGLVCSKPGEYQGALNQSFVLRTYWGSEPPLGQGCTQAQCWIETTCSHRTQLSWLRAEITCVSIWLYYTVSENSCTERWDCKPINIITSLLGSENFSKPIYSGNSLLVWANSSIIKQLCMYPDLL